MTRDEIIRRLREITEDRDNKLRELQAAPQWQPIETAPRDGRVCVIAGCKPHEIVIGYVSYDGDIAGRWFAAWIRFPVTFTPTHWMPIPPLPTDTHQDRPVQGNIYDEAIADLQERVTQLEKKERNHDPSKC